MHREALDSGPHCPRLMPPLVRAKRSEGHEWYWVQTRDKPAMIRYLDHQATMATLRHQTASRNVSCPH
ncbi:hypothetical protein TNCV_2625051 [Trichonephila clavipes]|nr:hypothetical protein TNCV_2625051 [Trichonephila clavipes]